MIEVAGKDVPNWKPSCDVIVWHVSPNEALRAPSIERGVGSG